MYVIVPKLQCDLTHPNSKCAKILICIQDDDENRNKLNIEDHLELNYRELSFSICCYFNTIIKPIKLKKYQKYQQKRGSKKEIMIIHTLYYQINIH